MILFIKNIEFKRLKHVGAESIHAERKKLLDRFDQSKAQMGDDPVKVDHGNIAELAFRDWLQEFLPNRFGVTKGYIITPSLGYEGSLEEWDIIVYDALESPVLFYRDGVDKKERRAIPIEYVRAVIEVKATLNPSLAKKTADKLLKLKQFMGTDSSPNYPEYLSKEFFCTSVFFETGVRNLAEYRRALDSLTSLYQDKAGIPFIGSLVLRSQKEPNHTGYLQALLSETSIPFPDEMEMSNEFRYVDGGYGRFGTIMYAANLFPQFIFDLLAYLKGTKTNLVSSFYGFDMENSQGSNLFK